MVFGSTSLRWLEPPSRREFHPSATAFQPKLSDMQSGSASVSRSAFQMLGNCQFSARSAPATRPCAAGRPSSAHRLPRNSVVVGRAPLHADISMGWSATLGVRVYICDALLIMKPRLPISSCRNVATQKLLKHLLRSQGVEAESIVTGGLVAYGSALRRTGLKDRRRPRLPPRKQPRRKLESSDPATRMQDAPVQVPALRAALPHLAHQDLQFVRF